jgi:hypothetical protein
MLHKGQNFGLFSFFTGVPEKVIIESNKITTTIKINR